MNKLKTGINSQIKISRISKMKWVFTALLLFFAYTIVNATMKTSAEVPLEEFDASEKLVEIIKKPATGGPLDYTALENYQVAAGILYNATYFEGTTNGIVKANAPIIGDVTQTLTSNRIKRYNQLYTDLKSTGTVNAAEQKFISKGDNKTEVLFAKGKVKDDRVEWGNIGGLTAESYTRQYGMFPFEIGKYRVNPKTILDQKIEKVGNNYNITFKLDVSDILENGERKFNPSVSSYYRELQTVGDAVVEKFNSLELSLLIDENWIPLSSTVKENYVVKKLGFSVDTRGEITETFAKLNDIQEFPKHVDRFTAITGSGMLPPEYKEEKNALSYLMKAFEPLMTEKKTFDLNLDLNGKKLDILLGLSLADEGGMNISAVGNVANLLKFSYKNNKIYIDITSNSNLSGYIDVSDINKLLETLGIEGSIDNLDTDNIMEMLSENSNLTIEGDTVILDINLVIDKININAKIVMIEKNDGVSLENITFNINNIVKGELKYSSQTYESLEFPINHLENKSFYLDLISRVVPLVKSKKIYMNGNIQIKDYVANLSGDIDFNDGFKAQFNLNLLNENIKLIIDNKNLYITFRNNKFYLNVDDIKEIIPIIEELTNNKLSAPDLNKLLDTLDKDKLKKIFESIQINSEDIKLDLSEDTSAIIKITDVITFNLTSKEMTLDLTVKEGVPFESENINKDDYIDLITFKDYIIPIYNFINDNKEYQISIPKLMIQYKEELFALDGLIHLSLTDSLKLNGKFNLAYKELTPSISFMIEDNMAYIILNNQFKIKLSLTEFINIDTKTLKIEELLQSIKTISINKETHELILEVTLNEVTLNVTVELSALKQGKISISKLEVKTPELTINTVDLEVIQANYNTVEVIDKDNYKDGNLLISHAQNITKLLTNNELEVTGTFQYGKIEVELNGLINRNGKILNADFEITVLKDVKLYVYLRESQVYVNLGNIKLTGSITELKKIILEVLEKQGITTPNIKLDNDFVQVILDTLEGLIINEDNLNIDIKDYDIKLSQISKESLNIEVNNKELNGNITVLRSEKQIDSNLETKNYDEIKNLKNFILRSLDVVQSESLGLQIKGLKLEVLDQIITVDVKVNLDFKNNKYQVYMKYDQYEFIITYMEDTVLMNINHQNKILLTLDELKEITENALEINLISHLLDTLEKPSISDILSKLSINILDNQIVISYDNLVSLELSENNTKNIEISNISIKNKALEVENIVLTPNTDFYDVNKDDYKQTQVIRTLMKHLKEIMNNKAVSAEFNVQYKGYTILGKVNLDLNDELKVDLEVYYEDLVILVYLRNSSIYFEAANMKFKLDIKDIKEIIPIIEELTNNKLSAPDLNKLLDTLDKDKLKKIFESIQINSEDIKLDLSEDTSAIIKITDVITFNLTSKEMTLDLTVKEGVPFESENINKDDYIDLITFKDYIIPIYNFINDNKEYQISIPKLMIQYKEETFTLDGLIHLSLTDSLKLNGKFNLAYKELTPSISFMIEDNMAYIILNNQFKIKLSLTEFINIDTKTLKIEELLQSIKTISINKETHELILEVTLNEVTLNVTVELSALKQGKISISKLEVKTPELTINTVDLEVIQANYNTVEVTDKDNYKDGNLLISHAQNMANLLTNNELEVTGTVQYGKIEVELNGLINRNGKILNADFEITVLKDVKLYIYLRESQVYVNLGNIKLTGSITELKEIILEVLEKQGITTPNIKVDNDFVQVILDTLEGLIINEDNLNIDIKDYNIKLSQISKESLNIEVSNKELNGNITVLRSEKQIDSNLETKNYDEIKNLKNFILRSLDFVQSESLGLQIKGLKLEVLDQIITVDVKVNLDFKNNKYQVYMKYDQYEFVITYMEDTVLININHQNKILLTLDELKEITENALEINLISQLLDTLEKPSISDILSKLSINILDNQIVINYDDLVSLELSENNTKNIEISNISIKNKALEVENIVLTPNTDFYDVNKDDYKQTQVIRSLMKHLKEIMNNKAVSAEFNVQYKGYTILGKVNLDLNDELKVDLEVHYEDLVILVYLRGETIYLEVAGVKLKLHSSEITTLITEIKQIMPNFDFTTIENTINSIKSPKIELNKILDILTKVKITNQSVNTSMNDLDIEMNVNYTDVSANINSNDLTIAADIRSTVVIPLISINDSDFSSITSIIDKIAPLYDMIQEFINKKELTIQIRGNLRVPSIEKYLEHQELVGEISFKEVETNGKKYIVITATFESLLGQKIEISYLEDGYIYVTVNGGIKVKVDTNNSVDLIREINKYVPEGLSLIPEINLNIDNLISQLSSKPINIIKLINSIKGLSIDEGKVNLNLELDGLNTNLEIDLNKLSSEITIVGNLTINDKNGLLLELDMEDMNVQLNAHLNYQSNDKDAYIDLEELMDFIPAVMNTLDYSFYDITINTSVKDLDTNETNYIFGTIEVLPLTSISNMSFPELYLELYINNKPFTKNYSDALHRIKLLIRTENNDTRIYLNYNDMKIEIGYQKALQIVDTVLNILDLRIPPIQNLVKNMGPYEPLNTSAFDKMDFSSLNNLRNKVNEMFDANEGISNYQQKIQERFTKSLDLLLKNTYMSYVNGSIEITMDSSILIENSSDISTIRLKKTTDSNNKDRLSQLTVSNLNLGNIVVDGEVSLNRVVGNLNNRKAQLDFKETMNFDSIYEFLRGITNTATLNDYQIKGNLKVKMSVIGIPFNWDIPFDIKMKVIDGKIEFYGQLGDIPVVTAVNNDVPYKVGDTGPGHNRKLYFYYKDGMIYLNRKEKVSRFLQKDRDYEKKVKYSAEEFSKDPYELIKWSIGFGDSIMSAIKTAFQKEREVPFVLTNILKEYSYDERNKTNNLKLDMGVLSGNKDLNDITLQLKSINDPNSKYYGYLYQAGFNLNIAVSVLNIDLSATNIEIYNMGQKVDLNPLHQYIKNN